jgi:hypothetical protein
MIEIGFDRQTKVCGFPPPITSSGSGWAIMAADSLGRRRGGSVISAWTVVRRRP